MFIRRKFIKGKPYAYLVENAWKKKGARQSVQQYLGRIFDVEPIEPPVIPDELSSEKIIPSLIQQELTNISDIKVDPKKKTVRKGKQKVVIALNGGYLCDYTLKQLAKAVHTRNESTPGLALAEALSRAGLRIPQRAFISLYKSFQP